MVAGALTTAQLAELRKLADQYKDAPAPPMATLIRLADDWNVDYSTLAHEYTSFTAVTRGRHDHRRTEQRQGMGMPHRQNQPPAQPSPRPAAPNVANPLARLTGRPLEVAVSPVAGVRAALGSVYRQGKNWVLINARIKSGYEPREVAQVLDPPLSIADYRRVEDGELNPSADQVAQLCQLLEVRMEEAFVMAGPDRDANRRGRTFIKGLALLEILMARRRMTMKAVGEATEDATGTKVSATLIGRIKRGEFTGPRNQAEQDQVSALALFFDIPEEWVTRQVPPELVQLAAANTAKLHAAIRQAFGQLQQIDEDRPHLLTSGSDKK